MPGPGQYSSFDHTNLKSAPKYGFGTSQKEGIVDSKKLKNVGPGSYDLNQIMGTEGNKTSISPKLNDKLFEKESRNIPGPGAYEIETVSTIQS